MTGYDTRKRAKASGYTWMFPRWPVDIVPVVAGGEDPRREGRPKIRHQRYQRRHDLVDGPRWPFDWPTARMMIDTAAAAYERMIPKESEKSVRPEDVAKAEQAIIDAERSGATADELCGLRMSRDELLAVATFHDFRLKSAASVVEHLRAVKGQIDRMATNQVFSVAAIAPILADIKSVTWMHKSAPPLYRDGQQLSNTKRFEEGVHTFVLPLTTHDPSGGSSWVYAYEHGLLQAAMPVYLRDRAALPAELVADCEEIWRDEALASIGGMGHVPWGYVFEFDEAEDVTLLELPSSNLIGWMFGDVYTLVLTVKKADLARNDFSRPLVQITN